MVGGPLGPFGEAALTLKYVCLVNVLWPVGLQPVLNSTCLIGLIQRPKHRIPSPSNITVSSCSVFTFYIKFENSLIHSFLNRGEQVGEQWIGGESQAAL